jgi:hypothetical protein
VTPSPSGATVTESPDSNDVTSVSDMLRVDARLIVPLVMSVWLNTRFVVLVFVTLVDAEP